VGISAIVLVEHVLVSSLFTDFSWVEFRLAEEGVTNGRIVIAICMYKYFMA